MSARWYKRCGADFIHGTMMLTLEEKGAYSLCLDLIYDRGGPIPDDARWLSGVCGCSMRKWTVIRARLIALGKVIAADGHLSNPRADKEVVAVSAAKNARNLDETNAKPAPKVDEKTEGYCKDKDLDAQRRGEENREEEAPKGARPVLDLCLVAMSDWNTLRGRLWPTTREAALTVQRRKQLKARIAEHGIEVWREALAKIEPSAFLSGRRSSTFKADIDFMLQPSSFQKVIEGKYDDRSASNGAERAGPNTGEYRNALARAAAESDAAGVV